MNCSNCGREYMVAQGLEILHAGDLVVHICGVCIVNVSRLRVTMGRETQKDDFEYVQYTPVSLCSE